MDWSKASCSFRLLIRLKEPRDGDRYGYGLACASRPKLFISRVAKLRKLVLYWFPVLLWMAVIFSASGDSNSMDHSSRIIGPIIKFLFPDISHQGFLRGILIGRKFAHVGVYAVLSALLWVAFMGTFEIKPDKWNWRPVLWTLGLIAIYAVSDEIHQTFVPTRQGTAMDVLIDLGGATLAIACIWVAGRLRKAW